MNSSIAFPLLLTLLAGLATGIGSAIAFFAHRTNVRFLSFSLGLSAGVMIYVSFVELFAESQTLLTAQWGATAGVSATVACFFGGILLIGVIDRLVPSFENPHEMHSVEEMNRKVINAINECVAADDRLYILGDFTYRLPLAEAVRLRERIECQNVTLIRGNHDGDWEDPAAPQIWEDVRDYLEIAPGYAKGHRLVMSHYPMLSWNGKARGAIMLHGHIHSRGDRTNARNRDRERPILRYDVGLDANDYRPVSRDQILGFFGL